MADRPPGVRGLCSSVTMAIVEAGEGMTGMFVPAQDTFSLSPHDTHRVSYTIRRNSGGSSSHWQMEKTIPMGSGCSFIGSLGRHLLLYMCGSSSLEAGCFTLDVKTFKLERVCASEPIHKSHAYCNFPPSILSSPTVSSVTGHADQQGVPLPELREADPGGVEGSGQESPDPPGLRRVRAVLAEASQAPNPVFFADGEADLMDEEEMQKLNEQMVHSLLEGD